MQNHEQSLEAGKMGTGQFVDFSGDWKNEIGSTMLLVQSGMALSGDYTSIKSSDGMTTKGDLLGYVDGDLISFVVHWRDFQSITSWVGQCLPKTNYSQFQTLWQMTKQVPSGDEWASINVGTDTFFRL